MRFILAGKGVRAEACLAYLLKNHYQPILVIGQKGDQSSFIKLAKQKKIPTYIPKSINSKTAFTKINSFKPDLLVLAGYSQILKNPIINLPSKGTINLHGGPLPAYRGASVLNWQIIEGETTGGLSIIFVDQGIDTGNTIVQKKFPILKSDTIKEVVKKTLKLFPPMLLTTLKQIQAGTVTSQSQDPNVGRYWRKRNPADGCLDWNKKTTFQACNFIRALTKPYPGAYSYFFGEKVYLWQAKLIPHSKTKAKPGTIISLTSQGMTIKALDQAILVTDWSFNPSSSIKPQFLTKAIGQNLSHKPTLFTKDQDFSKICKTNLYSLDPSLINSLTWDHLTTFLPPKSLVSARIKPHQTKLKTKLTNFKFYKIGDLNTYQTKTNQSSKLSSQPQIKTLTSQHLQATQNLARTSFKYDRFHQDPHISSSAADATRALWIKNSIKSQALFVLGSFHNGTLTGFISVKKITSTQAVIDLIAVNKSYQQQGIASTLIQKALKKLTLLKINSVQVSTQSGNIASTRCYLKNNFKLVKTQSTYHYFKP